MCVATKRCATLLSRRTHLGLMCSPPAPSARNFGPLLQGAIWGYYSGTRWGGKAALLCFRGYTPRGIRRFLLEHTYGSEPILPARGAHVCLSASGINPRLDESTFGYVLGANSIGDPLGGSEKWALSPPGRSPNIWAGVASQSKDLDENTPHRQKVMSRGRSFPPAQGGNCVQEMSWYEPRRHVASGDFAVKRQL